ncbi:hypothetical protein ABENE_15605 [Asticcacaulis benevestitus DSM 16100 = ATCC BAA-896]|uniref:Uncharacterized protein n=1 Tax=Asticcacaulis benevestitus DSM 16100 = ATCC BAA-896 TaxID=1121022 RepID=V4PKC8_9CAUL|nr:hypothetical protein ABENE_15605 [Asticcacaulis benevestitus DSM 16100 = ATCC BAA-896]
MSHEKGGEVFSLVGSPTAIEILLSNVMDDAIKYSPDGSDGFICFETLAGDQQNPKEQNVHSRG